ncbi:ribonuclease HII [Candidatus Pacearchaeota archaeon]|nr:MAG: ribonuclease HII [Candidatus Pacearchaeota archaeon]
MLILGIDDAGRGPVIGPMVLAGCLIDEKTEKDFKKLGVKDSKLLTTKRRDFLAKEIKEKAESYEVVLSYPNEIDGTNNHGVDLNKLEALKAAEIINKINKGFKKLKVIIDCPSVSISKWKDFLKTKIENLSNLEFVIEHKADKNYISVAAASILAKDVREKEIKEIQKKYGKEIGSGYCSDPVTMKFLEKYAKKHKEDGIFRKTWTTWKKACSNLEQRKLFN